MQVIHAAVLNIIELAPDAGKGAGEGIGIHQHAEQIVAFVPGRIGESRPIQFFQRFGTGLPAAPQHTAKVFPGVCIPGIKLKEKTAKFIFMSEKTGGKIVLGIHSGQRFHIDGSPFNE